MQVYPLLPLIPQLVLENMRDLLYELAEGTADQQYGPYLRKYKLGSSLFQLLLKAFQQIEPIE